MPYRTRRLKSGKYRVSGPGGVHAKATTKAKAKKQVRLLRAIDHGFVPTRRRRKASTRRRSR